MAEYTNGRDILEKIVAEKGDCSWAVANICNLCPMSKLKKRADGSHFSCLEATNAADLHEQEQNERYKEVAKRLLLDLNIEDMLSRQDAE